ncbi:hypothetical protein [Ideonella sp.]|uniref:hypothetical protein n=1 Tax=Ideonella sp. TaxID=1929293 RepID=UPI003BB712F8
MDSHLITLLLRTTGEIQAAVRDPAGQVYAVAVPNSDVGVTQFQNWATRAPKLRARGNAHSCFASQTEGDAPLFASPFFRLVSEYKGNTAVWAEPLWEVAAPGIAASSRRAETMFSHCAATVGRR